jgi:hypothetical protein
MARLDVEWSESLGIWYVKDFVDVHSHDFAKPQHAHVLRSHRGLNDPQKAEAVELALGGLRPFQIMDVMETSHGGPGETGFISQDLYNFISAYKKEKIEESDAEFVLNHMRVMEEKDPEFFFTYSKDAHGRLKTFSGQMHSHRWTMVLLEMLLYSTACTASIGTIFHLFLLWELTIIEVQLCLVAVYCRMKLSRHMSGCFVLYCRRCTKSI